jgi:hypothetical protein
MSPPKRDNPAPPVVLSTSKVKPPRTASRNADSNIASVELSAVSSNRWASAMLSASVSRTSSAWFCSKTAILCSSPGASGSE